MPTQYYFQPLFYVMKNLLTSRIISLICSVQKQGTNSKQTFNMRKLQAEQERMQNYKLESGRRREERERNKQDKLWGLGRTPPWHKHPYQPTPPVPRKYSVCIYTGECYFSFCLTYVLATASHYLGAFRITLFTSTHHHTTLPSMNISTDELLWTVKIKGWLQAAAAKLIAVWPLPSVYMGRTGCHGAYPLI